MAFESETAEMFCPKCKQSFEQGSRRFCPTDGTRLTFEAVDAERQADRGIFSHIIHKSEVFADRDEKIADIPRFAVTEPRKNFLDDEPRTDKASEPFFEIGDAAPDFETDADFLNLAESDAPEPKLPERKVNPLEIPAGHVELDDSYRQPSAAHDFNAADPESFVGRMVKGRYYVTELFDESETGFAYLADDRIVENKKVLVHVLLSEDTDEIMDSIYAEERGSLAHLNHPNIARLIDSGEFAGGTRFLITEYVDALSIRDILSIHGRFDALRAARVIRQAAQALSEVHQEGILHRDIRPDNIILNASEGEKEHVKLINFGVSNGQPTSENLVYKSPEVLDGRISTIASDIYSLSMVAFELLTGEPPFPGTTVKEVLNAQRGELFLEPTKLRPELPVAIDAVFQKALSFNAVDRYAKARDFGEAYYTVLNQTPQLRNQNNEDLLELDSAEPTEAPPRAVTAETVRAKEEITLKPLAVSSSASEAKPELPYGHEPAWKNRSPEPPQTENSRSKLFFAAGGIVILLSLLGFGWFYIINHPSQPDLQLQADHPGNSPGGPTITSDIEVPPLPRQISQPPNTDYYQNSKQNLKGDLLRNFVGFSLYYPKGWKVNGPQESTTTGGRGKFLDISKTTPDGKPKEQMLISYYTSKGTYKDDAEKFPQLVKETNETLKKLIPSYQVVSEGEIKVNVDWRAYEVKFQGGGTAPNGEKLIVWGRRLFIPAARPGVRNGFEITMLATSLADEVRSVDDVGVKGDLGFILDTFEPSQNF